MITNRAWVKRVDKFFSYLSSFVKWLWKDVFQSVSILLKSILSRRKLSLAFTAAGIVGTIGQCQTLIYYDLYLSRIVISNVVLFELKNKYSLMWEKFKIQWIKNQKALDLPLVEDRNAIVGIMIISKIYDQVPNID